jgi:hypothetical protein
MRKGLLICLLVFTARFPAVAQTTSGEFLRLPFSTKAGTECSGGTAYDDGSFETGYKFNSFAVSTGSYAMAFDLPANADKITAVCICWVRSFSSLDSTSSIAYGVNVWAADGPSGQPGTLLGQGVGNAQNVGLSPSFFRTELDIPVSGTRVWIGPQWSPGAASLFYVCADENGPAVQPAVRSESQAPPTQNLLTVFPNYRTLGIRAEFSESEPPPPPPNPDPPAGSWLTTSQLPDFQFKVRIGGTAVGTQVADCVPETLCVAGAIPTRSELFLRIIGPRPNGLLWAQVIRFTTSRLEVWIQRTSGGTIRYYDLAAVSQDSAVLSGLVDKEAFQP